MHKLLILTFSIFILFQAQSTAQHYRTAAGIRLGNPKTIGLTVQQKIYKNFTLEGILQAGSGDSPNSLILLGEQHHKILFKRLNLYYGLGLHKSWFNNTLSESELKNPTGVSAITGLEVAIGRMAVSLDIQPNLNVFGGDQFLNTTTGVSLRYVVVKPKKKKKNNINWRFWKKD
jgi:hypothetical protein